MSVATPRLALAVAAIFLGFRRSGATLTFPTLTGRVVDEAGLLGPTGPCLAERLRRRV